MTEPTFARIIFTIPAELADAMEKQSQPFYLDVFGGVRHQETTEKIGDWMRVAPGTIVHRFTKESA